MLIAAYLAIGLGLLLWTLRDMKSRAEWREFAAFDKAAYFLMFLLAWPLLLVPVAGE